MPEPFFPQLPILIPASPGMHFGWQVSWWVFQIVVMGTLLIVLQRMGVRLDEKRSSKENSGQH